MVDSQWDNPILHSEFRLGLSNAITKRASSTSSAMAVVNKLLSQRLIKFATSHISVLVVTLH